MKSGAFEVPSTWEIAEMFNPPTGIPDAEITALRADLTWMYKQGLLFNELQIPAEQFLLVPRQPAINTLLASFAREFVKVHPQRRELDAHQVVENRVSAVRLVALKEIYRAHLSDLPGPLASDFLVTLKLIPADEFCGFARSMNAIEYLSCDPPPSDCKAKMDRDLRVEPGRRFRSQDMYIELRALDYFSHDRSNSDERRASRLQLRKQAQDFVSGSRKSSI